jgi:hypothetical protein
MPLTTFIDGAESKSIVTAKTIIKSGTGLSSPLYIGDCLSAVGFISPDGWDPVNLYFQAAPDGVNWVYIGNYAGSVYSLSNMAQNYFYSLSLTTFMPWRWIRVTSGPAGSPTNQSATRVFTFLLRALA